MVKPGWLAFYVDSPEEFSAILGILRNEKGIRIRPSDFAIKTQWIPTTPPTYSQTSPTLQP